ncbi:MAG: hypothetical protein HKN29_15760, partial [Rhodothermales bacterium]|nr:hypothetical protein [Rhodothermales bacterium]
MAGKTAFARDIAWMLVAVLSAVSLALPLAASAQPAEPASAVPAGMTQSPAESNPFSEAMERASDMAPLNSLLIWHRDSLMVEAYYRGMQRSRRANVKSASKTILSALTGMALADGLIDSLDQPLA